MMTPLPSLVLDFWFKELTPKDHFKKSEELDQHIRDRFSLLHQMASQSELFSWRKTPRGRLAEIIVLDQFSRNIYRDSPLAFRWDELSLALAQEAIYQEADQKLNSSERAFLYMPFMHSESKIIHEEALRLFTEAGLEDNLKFEIAHKKIIDQFGRYPHRNELLGRESTPEELEFLKTPGSSF